MKKRFRIDRFNFSANTPKKEQKEELEADYFSLSLLMPEEKIKELLQLNIPVFLIARYFGVSISAVRYRMFFLRNNL